MAIEVDDEVVLPTAGGPLVVRWAGDPTDRPDVEVLLARVGTLGARPLVRIHSECVTGEVLGSARCDCGAQLAAALDAMRADPDGGLLAYVRGHEGRAVGLRHKLAAYRLQDGGADTFAANRQLGLPEDARRYDVPAAALAAVGVRDVRLLTDNPHKVAAVRAAGIAVEQVALAAEAPPASAAYVRAKLAWFARYGLTISPTRITGMNHAVLYVRDARRHAEWYERVLGFRPVVVDDAGRYAFMRAPLSENHHDIAFFTVGPNAPHQPPGGVGLYHLAWEVPTIDDLRAARDHLAAAGALVGSSDHGVNKSLYCKDPDGIEFEVMYLVPKEEWGEEEHEAIVRPLVL